MNKVLASGIIVCIMSSGCSGGNGGGTPTPPLPASSQTYSASINDFDALGNLAATFAFTQVLTTPAGGGAPTGIVNMTITGVAPFPLCFSYDIEGQTNAVRTISYQNSTNGLPPGITTSPVQVSTTPTRIDIGTILIKNTAAKNNVLGC